jgi:hypothetical protein
VVRVIAVLPLSSLTSSYGIVETVELTESPTYTAYRYLGVPLTTILVPTDSSNTGCVASGSALVFGVDPIPVYKPEIAPSVVAPGVVDVVYLLVAGVVSGYQTMDQAMGHMLSAS